MNRKPSAAPPAIFPADLVDLTKAPRFLPSPPGRPGKRVCLGLLFRLVLTGRLRAWRRCGRYYVQLADAADVLRAARKPQPQGVTSHA